MFLTKHIFTSSLIAIDLMLNLVDLHKNIASFSCCKFILWLFLLSFLSLQFFLEGHYLFLLQCFLNSVFLLSLQVHQYYRKWQYLKLRQAPYMVGSFWPNHIFRKEQQLFHLIFLPLAGSCSELMKDLRVQ